MQPIQFTALFFRLQELLASGPSISYNLSDLIFRRFRMRLNAFAKINWSLDITGIREDGYHLLDMLMQPISVADTISLLPSSGLRLTVSGCSTLTPDDNNLALRAARILKSETGYSGGVEIHITKRIPVGAGMGGGSADAAGVLTGLNRLWHLGLTQPELEKLGLCLGADVPFCIRGGLVRTSGIGEKMTDLPYDHSIWLVVIQPDGSLSTGAVFRAYDNSVPVLHPDNDLLCDALFRNDYNCFCRNLINVLQPVSSRLCPPISEAVSCLRRQGADAALMTGSGNAVFGVFPTRSAASDAQKKLIADWPSAMLCHTQRNSVTFFDL